MWNYAENHDVHLAEDNYSGTVKVTSIELKLKLKWVISLSSLASWRFTGRTRCMPVALYEDRNSS